MHRILIFGEMPPFSTHGVSLSNRYVSKILKKNFFVDEMVESRQTASWNVSKAIKSLNTLLDLVKILIYINLKQYHYIYTPFPTSVLGSLKIIFTLIIINFFSRKTECILHVHRGDLMAFYNKNKFTKKLVGFCFNRAKHIIVLSDFLKNELINLGYKGVIRIANTVMDDFTPQSTNKPSNEIIMIANYHVDKGFYVMIDAIKVLKDLGRRYTVNFFGDGDPSEFERYADELGVQSFCNFSKPIFGTAKAQKIADSKLLVLPSFNEGQPLVILEAMQMSTLVVASNVGYIKETLGQEYPFIVEPGNPIMLAKIIDAVMSTPDYNEYKQYLCDRFNTYFSQDLFEKNINMLFPRSES